MFEVEKSQTEVLQMECKHTDEYAHRESTHYQSGETLNGEVRKGSGEALNFGRIHSTKPSPCLREGGDIKPAPRWGKFDQPSQETSCVQGR